MRLMGALAVLVLTTVLVPATSSGAEGTIADQLAKGYEQATAIAEELASIESALAQLEVDIERHDAEIAEIRDELAALEDDVREIAVRRYVSAGNAPITYSDDLHQHQRIDVMMSAVQRDASATMDAYESASDRLETTNRALAGRLADQEAAKTRLAQRLLDLTRELERLGELQRQADLESARIEAELRQEAAARAAAASTTTSTTTTTSAVAAGPTTTAAPTTTTSTTTSTTSTTTTTLADGDDSDTDSDDSGSSSSAPSSGFLCPVKGVSVFTDSWRAPRSGGRAHMGVDMLATIGTPVVAPVSGSVVHRWNDLGGHSYHLTGDDGNFYYGTHLSEYGASGQVAAGTVIGYVGDTGNAAGIPHLHFEIHIGGRGNPINPFPTVKAAC